MESYKPEHLSPTYYLNSNHPEVAAFANEHAGTGSDKEKAVNLYYAVRDGFRYYPYDIRMKPEELTASSLIARKKGHCIDKAILLCAVARAAGIPARLEFADVRNHISSQKFLDLLKSDVFAMHGITQLFIDGKWVKATPAFNIELCEMFNVAPLDFDGEQDSMFQEFDHNENKFMEYVAYHGVFDDFPRSYFAGVMILNYPHLFDYERLRKIYVDYELPVEERA